VFVPFSFLFRYPKVFKIKSEILSHEGREKEEERVIE